MNNFEVRKGENENEFLIRIGKAKDNGDLDATWQEITNILNSHFRAGQHCDSESCWRKKYRRMVNDGDVASTRKRDENVAKRRYVRNESRFIDFKDKLIEAVKRADPIDVGELIITADKDKAIVAMLGDIHYGLCFSNTMGEYSPEIAKQRVMDYADYVVNLGIKEHATTVYVPLMGDLVSGIIHNTVRIENRESLVEQIIGVSELITAFILRLSMCFEHVYVLSVDGNHSRVDMSADAALRKERLDSLVSWYCKGRTAKIDKIEYIQTFDPSIGNFDILGKHYVCVHGDYDPNLRTSAQRLSGMLGCHIDYLLAGHTHVPEMTLEYTGYIRNGCVCGTGDDYTAKHRFHGPAVQVALVCTEDGVESINPYYMQ